MRTTKHLVSVWNPAYAQYAIDLTIQRLLEKVHKAARGEIGEDEVYVWWGKRRSPNRQAPLPHLEELRTLAAELDARDDTMENHLYLTDYRSLYVADLATIDFDDVRDDPDEGAAIPSFYERDWNVDCWFRLWDIRRLHTDDTIAVVKELTKLRNTRYNDRPVSLYGGMVDLPLIVTRDQPESFFVPEQRDRITGGTSWVEFDKEHSGIGETEARNSAAHDRLVDRDAAAHWRDLILGVGCEGHITSLGKAAERASRA